MSRMATERSDHHRTADALCKKLFSGSDLFETMDRLTNEKGLSVDDAVAWLRDQHGVMVHRRSLYRWGWVKRVEP